MTIQWIKEFSLIPCCESLNVMDHIFANLCSAIWWRGCNAARFSFRNCVFHVHDWPTPWCQVIFVSMILWCRVSQLACKHWQVWPPSMRSCAHPESDSDWCERCVKCYCTRFNCSYALISALMSSIHWFNCTEGSLRWKISKGLKKEDECSCPGIWKTFSLLSHTHTHQNM